MKRNIIIFLLIFFVITLSEIYPQWDVGTGKAAEEAGIKICKSIDSLNVTSTELNQKMIRLTNHIKWLTIFIIILTVLIGWESIIKFFSFFLRRRKNV